MIILSYRRAAVPGMIACFCVMAVSATAQSNQKSQQTEKKLPAGTYYIVNVETGQAITPAMSSSGQNVFLQDFNKDGMQKWKVVSKGKKYNILLNGYDDLFFQPHPSVADHTPIISLPTGGPDQFQIQATAAGHWLIRDRNGNYLSVYNSSTENEMRFGPVSGGSKNHLWEFRPI